MNTSKIFVGLMLLTLLLGYSIANPRTDDDDNGGGPVNTADSDKTADPKCISPGDFFDPVNLVTETDFLNSGGSNKNGQKKKNNNDENKKEENNNSDENKEENDNNDASKKEENYNDDEGSNDSDGTRYESSQNQDNGTNTVWKKLKVNRYYGVYRDRFFVRNIEGLIHIQLRDGDPFSKATMLGTDDDWRSEYIFARANIFYSQSKAHGAMHSIWGNNYALEIQYVHYKKSFSSLEEATKEKHGVLVVCILFESSGKETTYMDPIVAAAIMSIFPSDKFHVAHGPLDLKNLFPVDMTNLQYTGESLVPPCAREAKFVVLVSTRMVAEKQLSKFREVRDHEGKKQVGVFGKYQKKNKKASKESIKAVMSGNVRLSVESYEVLAGACLKASILFILFLSFATLYSNL